MRSDSTAAVMELVHEATVAIEVVPENATFEFECRGCSVK
jgi:hypothetical protein